MLNMLQEKEPALVLFRTKAGGREVGLFLKLLFVLPTSSSKDRWRLVYILPDGRADRLAMTVQQVSFSQPIPKLGQPRSIVVNIVHCYTSIQELSGAAGGTPRDFRTRTPYIYIYIHQLKIKMKNLVQSVLSRLILQGIRLCKAHPQYYTTY